MMFLVAAVATGSLTNDQMRKVQELTQKQITGVDIGLPMLVVLGDQSSGKSSILNAMLKEIGSAPDALPTDDDVCTRMPTMLSMFPSEEQTERWFVKSAAGEQEVLTDVKSMIHQEHERITARGEKISHDPFELRVQSPQVNASLILVDLPGLASNADYETESRELTEKFVSDNNVVMVVVRNAALFDKGNLKAVGIAEKIDPEGARTVHVYNVFIKVKTDDKANVDGAAHIALQHKGNDVFDSNLPRAPHAVVAGGVKMGRKIDGINDDRQGIGPLMDRLSEMLIARLKDSIPEAKKKVNARLAATEAMLDKVGRKPPGGEALLLKLQQALFGRMGGKEGSKVSEHMTDVHEQFNVAMAAVPATIITKDKVDELHKKNKFELPMFRGLKLVLEVMKEVYQKWQEVIDEYKPQFKAASTRWFDEGEGAWLYHEMDHQELSRLTYDTLVKLSWKAFNNETVGVHHQLKEMMALTREDRMENGAISYAQFAGDDTTLKLWEMYEQELKKDPILGHQGILEKAEGAVNPKTSVLERLKKQCLGDLKRFHDGVEDSGGCIATQVTEFVLDMNKEMMHDDGEKARARAAANAWAGIAKTRLTDQALGIVKVETNTAMVKFVSQALLLEDEFKTAASMEDPDTVKKRKKLLEDEERDRAILKDLKILE